MEAFKQGLAVVFVLGLLVAALWWLRRRGWAQLVHGLPVPGPARAGLKQWVTGRSTPAHRIIESLGRLPLSPQHCLHVVRFGERALLLALHSSGCVVLGEQPWPDSASQAWQGAGRHRVPPQ